jgi:hypothetical protein
MYDKYQTGNTFIASTTNRIPKHKGFLFSGGGTASFYLVNDQGNTFRYNINFTSGMNILPVQSFMVNGLTGLYLN